ncbi:MAG: DUF86 domain-containing protein [Firmicutes bacterium]|nr:DUF86 domain-containing protein [Bacillota bacterium]
MAAPKDVPKYTAMARFRNRFVHLYEDVDDEQVYRILREEMISSRFSARWPRG